MSEQIDIAVDLGVVPPPLAEIEFLREFVANVPEPHRKSWKAFCTRDAR